MEPCRIKKLKKTAESKEKGSGDRRLNRGPEHRGMCWEPRGSQWGLGEISQ